MYFDSIIKKKDGESESEKIAEAELSFYLCEEVVPINTSINNWWKNNESRFPKLCRLAKIYLSIPAIQVPANRAFPAKKGFIFDNRAEMVIEKMNVLDLMRIAFLNGNLNLFDIDFTIA